MNDPSAHKRRSRKVPGGFLSERSGLTGRADARDLVEQLEVLERLQAIVDELDRLDADVDVPRTLAEGLLEDCDREVAGERS